VAFFGRYYFSSYRHSAGEPGQVVEDFLRGREAGAEAWQPPTDIYETDDSLVVRMEIAGLQPRDVAVQLEGEVLTIRGRRREDCPHCKRRYCQMEIHTGPFERVLALPKPVLAEGARARYTNGILEILLPRAERFAVYEAVLQIEWTTGH